MLHAAKLRICTKKTQVWFAAKQDGEDPKTPLGERLRAIIGKQYFEGRRCCTVCQILARMLGLHS